jgi:hypothetical protein
LIWLKLLALVLTRFFALTGFVTRFVAVMTGLTLIVNLRFTFGTARSFGVNSTGSSPNNDKCKTCTNNGAEPFSDAFKSGNPETVAKTYGMESRPKTVV